MAVHRPLWRAELRQKGALMERSSHTECGKEKALVVHGGFNEILMGHEKEGGLPRPQSCMDKFREALVDCELFDLGFSGDMFTWRNNSHTSDHYICERLDRAVADVAWRSRFLYAQVQNGERQHSDHRPVIVTMKDGNASPQTGGRPTFRFEAGWIHEENCEAIVQNAWNLSMDVRSGKVASAVQDVAADLWDWSRNNLGDLEKRIKYVKKSL